MLIITVCLFTNTIGDEISWMSLFIDIRIPHAAIVRLRQWRCRIRASALLRHLAAPVGGMIWVMSLTFQILRCRSHSLGSWGYHLKPWNEDCIGSFFQMWKGSIKWAKRSSPSGRARKANDRCKSYLKLVDTTRTGLGNCNPSTHACCGCVIIFSFEPWVVLSPLF